MVKIGTLTEKPRPIEASDSRGEFWKYSGGGRVVEILIGGMDGLSVSTEDLRVLSGPKLSIADRVDILAEFISEMNPNDGSYNKVTLLLTNKFKPSVAQLIKFDETLSREGYVRFEGELKGNATQISWQRGVKK